MNYIKNIIIITLLLLLLFSKFITKFFIFINTLLLFII